MAVQARRYKTDGAVTLQPLQPDTVRLRWLSVDPADASRLASWRKMLDDDEVKRADRYYFDRDRAIFIAAHALTRAMLSEATGQPTRTWQYRKGEHGKPELAASCAAGALRFNISHTRGMVACAIACTDVGVDVEAADRRVDIGLAERVFAPEEVLVVQSASPEQRARVFLRFWTLKEAFIKATGEGLVRRLAAFSFALDPVRIAFHPERDRTPHSDEASAWQFAEYRPLGTAYLALAVRLTGSSPLRLDARAARPEEIMP